MTHLFFLCPSPSIITIAPRAGTWGLCVWLIFNHYPYPCMRISMHGFFLMLCIFIYIYHVAKEMAWTAMILATGSPYATAPTCFWLVDSVDLKAIIGYHSGRFNSTERRNETCQRIFVLTELAPTVQQFQQNRPDSEVTPTVANDMAANHRFFCNVIHINVYMLWARARYI